MRADVRGAVRPGVVLAGRGLYSVRAVGKGREGKGGWGDEVAHLLCSGVAGKACRLAEEHGREKDLWVVLCSPAAQSSGERPRVRIRWELLAVGETFLPGQAQHWGLCMGRGSSLGVY